MLLVRAGAETGSLFFLQIYFVALLANDFSLQHHHASVLISCQAVCLADAEVDLFFSLFVGPAELKKKKKNATFLGKACSARYVVCKY